MANTHPSPQVPRFIDHCQSQTCVTSFVNSPSVEVASLGGGMWTAVHECPRCGSRHTCRWNERVATGWERP